MGIRDRISQMGFGLPDIGSLRDQMDTRFNELLDELKAIRAVLEQIRDKP